MLSYNESLKILKETNTLLEGHFILSSGLHSEQYIQCAKLLSHPNEAEVICKSLSKKTDYLEFIFDIQIRELKNYKNLIGELKLKEYKFRIIRHRKKDAFLQRIFKNFKRN